MFRFLSLAAIALLCTPAVAAEPLITGEKDGIRFAYNARLAAGERVILDGVYLDTGESFTLVVDRRGRVEGDVGRRPVSFLVSRAQRESLLDSLRTRSVAVAAADSPLAPSRAAE